MKLKFTNHYFHLFRQVWSYAQGHRGKLVLAYLMFIGANIISMLTPLALAGLLNTLQTNSANVLQEAFYWITIYISIDLGFWILHGPARVIERTTAYHVSKQFYQQMFQKVNSLPLSWHKEHHSGDIISRLKKAESALSQFANESYQHIQTFLKFLISLIAIIYIIPKSGITAFMLGSIILAIILKFDKILVKLLTKINNYTHKFEALLFDYITNIKTVITLRIAPHAQTKINQKYQVIEKPLRKNIIINEVKWFSMNFCLNIVAALLLGFYIYEQLQLKGIVLIGNLMALYRYSESFINSFYNVGWQYEQVVWGVTNLQSINPIIKGSNTYKTNQSPTSITNWQTLNIKNLNFRYQDEKKRPHHLKNIDLKLQKAQKIAFIGESGSGKSTLLNLIRGIETATIKELMIDQQKFKTLSPLSNITTLIPQEPEIFANTIKYNICYGINTPLPEIQKFSKLSCFEKVIAKLPKGIDTDIKEKGVNLSGGEKQRLALARGLLAAKSSSIILLDEPTSSVDQTNEKTIYQNIFQHYSDRCIIAAVHKKHLLTLFDYIYQFENGYLIKQGTPQEFQLA